MAQPFRVIDGDDPGRDRGGWDENGNIDLPGTLTVDTIKGSGSSTPALTTVQFLAMVEFLAGVTFTNTVLNLVGDTDTDDVFTVKVDDDAFPQLIINANGRIELGGGDAPVDVNLFRDGAVRLHTTNTFVTEGDLVADTAGGGLTIREGANARMGAGLLTAGSLTVNTAEVTDDSRVFLTHQTSGTAPGTLRVSARDPGVSFTITSTSVTDDAVVAWLIVEPAA